MQTLTHLLRHSSLCDDFLQEGHIRRQQVGEGFLARAYAKCRAPLIGLLHRCPTLDYYPTIKCAFADHLNKLTRLVLAQFFPIQIVYNINTLIVNIVLSDK